MKAACDYCGDETEGCFVTDPYTKMELYFPSMCQNCLEQIGQMDPENGGDDLLKCGSCNKGVFMRISGKCRECYDETKKIISRMPPVASIPPPLGYALLGLDADAAEMEVNQAYLLTPGLGEREC